MIKKTSTPLRSRTLFKGGEKLTLNRQKNRSGTLHILTGIVKRHPDGFGFFIPEDSNHPDVYLPRRQMQGLMSNDQVKAAVFPRKHRKGFFSGRVLQLIKRAQRHIVGQYTPLSDKKGLIKDNSFQWGEDLKIQLNENQKIKKAEWVQAKVTHWPDSLQGFSGQITCSLGFFPKALEDNIRVVQKHSIPASFSPDCLKEAAAMPEHITKETLDQRKDLRSLPFITIDGKTAQDFDDAIYVSCHSKGWILYVAIADVSYYVQQGSAMDKEASARGNSTYFPGFTVPMLPEKLSNHLCSLKPGEDRLAVVAEIHFNHKGEKEKTGFYEAVIQSRARLNYGEAQDIIEQPESSQTHQSVNPGANHKDTTLLTCSMSMAKKLARQLLKHRTKKHFINLDIPETEVHLNALGEPVDISQSQRLFSHKLIEELMLAANKAVAEHLQTNKVPALYRVHDPPKTESLKSLELFINSLGLKTTLTEPDLQKKISWLIKKFSDHPLSSVVQTLILRSFSQAVYSAFNKKHFGLNTGCYTHFTSPIRRYSDLIIHRTLKAVLTGQAPPYRKRDLESLAETISACEQRSVKAERQIKDIKKARFLKKHLGEDMEGTISGITRFGFFVKLRLYDIEGLVHINNLNGKWQFEESLLELKSKISGRRFKMGDPVLIQVMKSNVDTGQIDFELKLHKKEKIQSKPCFSHSQSVLSKNTGRKKTKRRVKKNLIHSKKKHNRMKNRKRAIN